MRQLEVRAQQAVDAEAHLHLLAAGAALDVDVGHALRMRLDDHRIDQPHQRGVGLLDGAVVVVRRCAVRAFGRRHLQRCQQRVGALVLGDGGRVEVQRHLVEAGARVQQRDLFDQVVGGRQHRHDLGLRQELGLVDAIPARGILGGDDHLAVEQAQRQHLQPHRGGHRQLAQRLEVDREGPQVDLRIAHLARQRGLQVGARDQSLAHQQFAQRHLAVLALVRQRRGQLALGDVAERDQRLADAHHRHPALRLDRGVQLLGRRDVVVQQYVAGTLLVRFVLRDGSGELRRRRGGLEHHRVEHRQRRRVVRQLRALDLQRLAQFLARDDAVVDQQFAQRQVAVADLAAQRLGQVFGRQDAQRDQRLAQAQHRRARLQLQRLLQLRLRDQVDLDQHLAELQVAQALLLAQRVLQLLRRQRVLADEHVAEARPEVDAAIRAARIERALDEAGVADRRKQEQALLGLDMADSAARVRLAVAELDLELGVARHAVGPAGRGIDAVARRHDRLGEREALELAEAQLHRRARGRHEDRGESRRRVELRQAGVETLVVEAQDCAGLAGAERPRRSGVRGGRHGPVRRLGRGVRGSASRGGGQGGQRQVGHRLCVQTHPYPQLQVGAVRY